MPLSNFITKCRGSKAYFRGRVVWAIEDACVLLMLGIGTAAACVLLSAAVKWLGVG